MATEICKACRGKGGFDAIKESGEPTWVTCSDCGGIGTVAK